jgi:REP element-mobilizing transposase RayT
MPRIARNIIPDIPYHIIHRGNNRQKIFFNDTDYRFFLSLLKEAKKKYKCKLYAYVLMPNHFHLILESPQISENLAKYIKLLAQKYSKHINKEHKRTGRQIGDVSLSPNLLINNELINDLTHNAILLVADLMRPKIWIGCIHNNPVCRKIGKSEDYFVALKPTKGLLVMTARWFSI